MLLVHHGLFWGSGVQAIDTQLKRRLQILFDADIALAAYHLPLDAHPQLGNNALLAKALGATELTPFALHAGQPIGFLATLPGDGVPAPELFARVREITAREPLVFDSGPPRVRRLAIVSGAGADYLTDAVLGWRRRAAHRRDPRARDGRRARGRVHLIAAGHYATETFGISCLGEHLAERFGITHVFLDVPNPV